MDKQYRFPGPKSFTANESSVFFGRDEDIAQLKTSVIVNPTTLLFGRSGTGKSSLIQAGLIPALLQQESESENQIPAYIPVNVNPKPYDASKNTLCDRITTVIRKIVNMDDAFLDLRTESLKNSLWYLFKQFQFLQTRENKRQVLLLIFDQAEEIFTYPEGQIDQLVRELQPIIGQYIPESVQKDENMRASSTPKEISRILYTPIPVKFLFAIRSDRLHLITRLKKASPHILQNSYELLALQKEAAFQAMEGPSQHPGDHFLSSRFKIAETTKEYIFEVLSSHTDDPDSEFEIRRVEPFSLQAICSHIEQKVLPGDEDKIIEKHEIENPREIINGYYMDCIRHLTVSGRPLTDEERINVRTLVEERMLSNNRRIPYHQVAIRDDYGEEMVEILKELVSARILKKDYDVYGESIFEITHDYLVQTIQQAKDQRLGTESHSDDVSMQTINELLREIGRLTNGVSQTNEKEVKREDLAESSKRKKSDEKSVGKSGAETFTRDDQKLLDLYKKLGDAYIVIRDYKSAIESYNKAEESVTDTLRTSSFLDVYKSRSDAYYYLKEYEKSNEDLKKILSVDPNDYTSVTYLLDNFERQGKLDEAYQYITKLNFDPYNAGLFTELGNKFYDIREYEKARECYVKTIELNPQADYALRNIGLVDKALGNLDSALDYYERSLELNAFSAVTFNDVGNIYYARKDYAKARENYLKAIGVDPGFYYSYHNLGLINEVDKNFEGAIEYFQKATEVNPQYENSYLRMATIYYDQKNYSKAREVYVRLAELDPSNAENYHDLGLIEEKENDDKKAIEYYQKAINLNPAYENALIRLSGVYMRMEKYDLAKDIYKKLIEIDPDNELYYYDIGVIEEILQNYEEAIVNFKKTIDLKPDDDKAWFSLGKNQNHAGHVKSAINSIKKSIKLNPKSPEAFNGLGLCYFDQKDWLKARENFEMASDLDPDNYLYFSNLGAVETELGNFADAEKKLKKAVEIKPEDAISYVNFGELYEKMNRLEEAITNYKKGLELDPSDTETKEKLAVLAKKLKATKK